MEDTLESGPARDALFERLRTTSLVSDNPVVVEEKTTTEPPLVVVFVDIPAVATVRLDFPLALDDGEPIEILRMWPPTFAEVKRVVDGFGTEIELHAAMMRVPVAALRSLRWSDAERVTSIARVIAPELRRS